MIKQKQMPEWLEEKRRKIILNTDIDFGFEKCFEILWPQMELMKAALRYNANMLVYVDDDLNLNDINFLSSVNNAKKILKELEGMK